MAAQEQEILIRMQQRAAEVAKYAQLDYSEASISRLERTLDEIHKHIGANACWRRLGGRAWATLSICLREDSNSLICCLPTAKKRSAPSPGLCIRLTRDLREKKRAYWRDKYLKRWITSIARNDADILQWLILSVANY